MELGDAAQGQGVLHTAAAVLFHDAGALQQTADVAGGVGLVGVRTDRLHPGVKGVHHALQGLDRHGTDDVGGLGGLLQVPQGQSGHGGGGGSSGHQGQALLGAQGDGLQTGLGQCLRAGEQLALVVGLAPADEHQGHVGLGGEVAHAAVAGGPGGQPAVQEPAVLLQHQQPDAAVSLAQVLQDHQHDTTNPLDAQGLAHRNGVGQNDILLELGGLVLVDGLGAQRTEAGGHAVHDLALVHPAFHQRPGARHAGLVLRGEGDLGPEPGHGYKVFQGNGLAQGDLHLTFHHVDVPPKFN